MKFLPKAVWAATLVAWCAGAGAAPQATVRHTSFQDFRKGKFESIALLGTGALELGPQFAPCKAMPAEAFVWALVADSKGRVYAGTGNGGRVYVLEGDKARVVLATDDLEVLSLAVDARGNVYAGCAPSGRIYKIPPKGKPVLFCETKQTYVWALAVADGGGLYAGTGPEGKILRISPDGRRVTTVYDAEDRHILCLVAVGRTVYAGTGRNGIVYRVSPAGKVSIAYDSPRKELRCMAADDQGNVYFGSADGLRAAAAAVPRRVPSQKVAPPKPGGAATGVAVRKNSHTAKRPPAYVQPKRPGATRVAAANTVYRLARDGKVTPLYERRGVAFLSMAWHRGALYVGTTGEGEVVRIVSERNVAVVAENDPPEVLSVCGTPDGRLFIGTGNDGRVYVAGSERAARGTYTSKVIDAKFRSNWGSFQIDVALPAGTAVEVSTRSGNCEKPDDTWSAWSKPRRITARAPVESPPARFLQYRLILSTRAPDRTPRVRSAWLPYLPENHAPSIDSLDISSTVKAAPTGGKKAAPPAPQPQARDGDGCIAGSVTVSWRASDPNRDPLEFALYFRGRGEKNWKLLDERMTAASYTWDTETVPDGVYELKVVASDERANPPPRGLTDELVSEPVTVDNSPPAVRITDTAIKARRCTVRAVVRDAGSNVVGARYSLDAGAWQPLLADDRLFDAHTEALSLTTEELDPGEHTLVIQAEDSSGNVGSAKTVFVVPEQ